MNSPEMIEFEATIDEAFNAMCENRLDEWLETHKEEWEKAQRYEHFLMAREKEMKMRIVMGVIIFAVAISVAAVLILLTKRLLLLI